VNLTLRFAAVHKIPQAEEGSNSNTGNYYNVYARHGVVQTGPHAGKEIPQAKQFTDPDTCFFGYNSQTQRFEATGDRIDQLKVALADPNNQRSNVFANPNQFVKADWDHAAANLAREGVIMVPPADFPVAAFPQADCADPSFEPDPLVLNTPAQVVVAIDRSGSMNAQLGPVLPNSTRLDFAKDAAKSFFREHVTRGVDAPEVGLVVFSDQAQVLVGSETDPLRLRKLVKGTATDPATQVGITDLDTVLNGLQTASTANDVCSTQGRQTAIGDGIAKAGALLPDPSTNLQGVLLLSDGEENRFPDCSTNDPSKISKDFGAEGKQFYWVPTGHDTDSFGMQKLSNQSGGYLFDATNPAELPPKFMEIYAIGFAGVPRREQTHDSKSRGGPGSGA